MPTRTPSAAGRRRPTKMQTVSDSLADLAYRLGPGAKLPTVLELRAQLGVSGTTLHTALGDLEAQGVLFRRHGVGIFVSETLHRRNVALLCHPSFFFAPDVSPFWNILVEQIRARAASHDEIIHLHFATFSASGVPVADGLKSDIEGGRVDGVLSVGLDLRADQWLGRSGVPHVAFAGPARHVVLLDTSHVVSEGVAALAAQGCRRVGLWTSLAPMRPIAVPAQEPPVWRLFRESLAAAGLPYLPELCADAFRYVPEGGGEVPLSQQQQGYEAVQRAFGADRSLWPDGIVCTDDMMTRGMLTAFERAGIRVGADVRVATHGNVGSQVLLGYEDVLTRILVDPGEIVQGMFTLLETLLSGRVPSPPTLTVRSRRQE